MGVHDRAGSGRSAARSSDATTHDDRSLRAGMFASVELAASLDRKPVVAAPEAAVLNSGARQAVLVEKGEGRYEPREVKLGRKGDGFYEVVEGLAEGERVVVGANFLIDAESNLRAALKGFAEGERWSRG